MKSRPPPRPHRVLRLAGFGVAALVAMLAAGSAIRVPDGHLAATRGELKPAGWRLRPPLASVRIVPLQGSLDAVDVPRQTAEGAELIVRLSIEYDLNPGALRAHATEIERGGLAGLVGGLAAATLSPLPLGELMPPEARAGAGGRAQLSQSATAAVTGALRSAGVEPRRLAARIGPPGSFAAGAGAASMPSPESTGVRLLIIGLDGADWNVIDPLLAQRRLPNLARLIANGIRAPLRSYDPMISPLLWTTVATGVGPDVHGVADFQAIDGKTGRRVPISSRFRRVKALWNILGDAGLESAFVAWWASYPAEQIEGVQVSNLVVFETLRPKPPGAAVPPGLTFPPGYLDSIRPRIKTAADLSYEDVRRLLHISREEFEDGVREVLKPPVADADAANRRLAQRPIPLAVTILTGTRNYATIAADLVARRPAVTAVYFEGIDMFGHRFQHCMPPRMALCPDDDFARYRDAVNAFYVEQDHQLGRVLEAAGPGVTVMVLSDHGFRTGDDRPPEMLPFTTQQPVEWHDEEGILIVSGPAAARGTQPSLRASLFDIAPTVLYLVGLPSSEEMPGRVLTQALDPAFVESHPARTIRSYETVGRKPIIAEATGPGAEAAEEELLANLRALGYIGGETAGSPAPGDTAPGGSAAPPQATSRTGADEEQAGAAPPSGAPDSTGADTQVFYHRNLASYFMKRQEYAHAAEQLRLANQKQQLPKTYELLSEAYLGLGRKDDAITALEDGLKTLETMDPEVVLWMVQLRLGGAGGREAATANVRRWAARTAKRPGLDDAIAGLLKEDAGDTAAAAALYRRSLQADSSRVIAAQHLFALTPQSERAALLEPILRRALRQERRIDEYQNLLGVLLAEKGRHAEALASFRRATEIDPDNPRFAANLAAAYARAGLWQEAAAAYETVTALQPSASAYMKLGSAYRQLRRPTEALAAFERARALGDASSAPLLGMALARAEMNQADQALGILQEGLTRYPDDRALRSLYDDLVRKTRSPESLPGRPGRGR